MSAGEPRPDEVTIDVSLVRRLVAAQFSQWADLPVKGVDFDGWDNRTFRLGTHMSVRLPSAEGYIAQVEKEYQWLPRLAPLLPLPIPVPLAKGEPADGYPWPWSVYQWIEGENATIERIADLHHFATTLAHFLVSLRQIDAADGPPPGPHNFYRGGPLTVYDADTRRALTDLDGEIDTDAARAVWEAARAATWHGTPVWFHGDIAEGNLLLKGGQLSAVIDFGTSGVGDPSCDLAIAWTLFGGASRDTFRAALRLDDPTWARSRGWTLWKALITLAEYIYTDPVKAGAARHVIREVLADHEQGT